MSVEEQGQEPGQAPSAAMLAVYEERRDWFVREVMHEPCASDPRRASIFGVAQPRQDSSALPSVIVLDVDVAPNEAGEPEATDTGVYYLDRDRAGLLLDAISRQWPELL